MHHLDVLGRLVMFSSGMENMHHVKKVSWRPRLESHPYSHQELFLPLIRYRTNDNFLFAFTQREPEQDLDPDSLTFTLATGTDTHTDTVA